MNLLSPSARYFPVSSRPLVMKAGFQPLGTDFGNGSYDHLFFQKDQQYKIYREAKEQVNPERHWSLCTTYQHLSLHLRALEWIIHTLSTELKFTPLSDHLKLCEDLRRLLNARSQDPFSFPKNLANTLFQVYHTLALHVQEDLALLADQPTSSLIMGHISMPSFWDPQRIKGASFWEIHEPVPNFPKKSQLAERMGTFIATKGPFIRFVWTVANDHRLDHHPSGGRTPWSHDHPLWLRVERQITVPFEGLGNLFLIRTYLYPFDTLTPTQWDILNQAIQNMSVPIAQYKGLDHGRAIIIQNLNQRLNMEKEIKLKTQNYN